MKNIVSMVAVALFAGVFAVGCGGKHDKCTAVTTEKECVDASFVDSLKGLCKWNATDKKCENKGGSGSAGSGSGSAGSGSGSAGSTGTTP